MEAWISTISRWVQQDLNTGVYKVGFAKDQETYNTNIVHVYGALNKLEEFVHWNGGPYMFGKKLTELDIQVYTTLIRFDTAYVQHFKLNLGMIRYDYPNLNNWMKNLYWNVKGFKETTDFRHIKEGVCQSLTDSLWGCADYMLQYTKAMTDINPNGITPIGPLPDIEEGFEPDFSKIRIGSIDLPAVLQYQATLAS
jgi:glutathionyl-hydroquinone reductase